MRECIAPAIQKAVRLRDNNTCRKCGQLGDVEIHHIEAVSDDGANTLANLACLCFRCHKEWHSTEHLWPTFDEFCDFPPRDMFVLACRGSGAGGFTVDYVLRFLSEVRSARATGLEGQEAMAEVVMKRLFAPRDTLAAEPSFKSPVGSDVFKG